jgi:hypothetical protein
MNDVTPFRFYSRSHQVLLLGRRARSVTELLEGVREVPPASIYYHTHRFLQQHHYLSPEPPNDFAYWVTGILNLDQLGESLASVDIMSHTQIEDLRQAFLDRLTQYVREGSYMTAAPPGEDFHFMACKTFVLPTPYEAKNLKEFSEHLSKVTLDTLYFHVFEAPLRLKREGNDFSAWFTSLGKTDLSRELAGFDPYTITLERMRQRLIYVVNKYV